MEAKGSDSVQFIGALDGGPVLVFGGAYSNLQALEAMLAVAKAANIPPQRIIHTGDVVAYCANPRETSELLMGSGVHCLMGNCEESVGEGKNDCGCGFPEDSACNEYSKNWYAHVMKEFKDSPNLKTWMAEMPRRIEFTVGRRRFAVVHGSPSHISGWMWNSMTNAELLQEFRHLGDDIDGIISGHSGIPFVKLVEDPKLQKSRLWLNAGVIGMPANDGTQRGWYAVMTPKDNDLIVQTHVLQFDANNAAEAVRNEPGLNRGYADALVTGIWPSHDVLPLTQQMETGVALKENIVLWKGKAPINVGAISCVLTALTATVVGLWFQHQRFSLK